MEICKKKPTIIVIYMERPAVFPEKLPFELPSSMQSVERQKEDIPSDAEKPLLPRGYHLPMTSARIPG